MKTWRARMLGRPTTVREVEAENFWNAPDNYVAENCKHLPGVCFIQVEVRDDEKNDPDIENALEPKNGWRTWRVEILFAGPPLGMLTNETTEEEARAFLIEYGVTDIGNN